VKILVLEDDPAQRAILCLLIRSEGHEVFEASSAIEALELLRTTRFQLALLDWELGTVLTGADVAKEVPTGCAKFMVTGHSITEMRANWRDPLQGILEVVTKPVDWDNNPKTSLKALIERVEKSFEDTLPGSGSFRIRRDD
jgi:CheY-like chemotaxis protein